MCGKFTVITDNNIKKDVFPGGKAKLYAQFGNNAALKELVWGFPLNFPTARKTNGSGLIFNSRAETVTEKPLFAESFRLLRVAVPVVGFSEWSERLPNGKRQENYFESEDGLVFYLAGLALKENPARFTVLTTAACSTKEIHSRFPLVLSETESIEYLSDYEFARRILRARPKELRAFPL